LLVDIHKMRPALAIKEGMFTDVQGYTIRVEKLNARTSDIEGVTIQKNKENEETETIVARRGKLQFTNQGNVLTLFLEDGEIHGTDEDRPSRYHRISFDTHTVRITDIGSELVRSEKKTRGDRELSASDMMERVRDYQEEVERIYADEETSIRGHLQELFATLAWEGPPGPERERMLDPLSRRNSNQKIRMLATKLGSQTSRVRDREKQIDKYMVEVHKKYALPVACIVFVLVGAPLGVRAHRGGIGVGVGFSILFFVVYYLFLMGGEKLADRGFVPPALAMWAANVVIGALGIYLVVRSTRESGFVRLPRFLLRKRGRSS